MSLTRQLRDLNPLEEPNTTKQIGWEAAHEIDKLRGKSQSYYEILRECEVEFISLGAHGIAETIRQVLA